MVALLMTHFFYFLHLGSQADFFLGCLLQTDGLRFLTPISLLLFFPTKERPTSTCSPFFSFFQSYKRACGPPKNKLAFVISMEFLFGCGLLLELFFLFSDSGLDASFFPPPPGALPPGVYVVQNADLLSLLIL